MKNNRGRALFNFFKNLIFFLLEYLQSVIKNITILQNENVPTFNVH